MKKIATVLMLVAVLLIGGMTLDAKTTKKSKAKTRTSQSSSSQWNNGVPSPKYLCTHWLYSGDDITLPEILVADLQKHGYKGNPDDWENLKMTKPGVCTIEYKEYRDNDMEELKITIENKATRQWFFNIANSLISKYPRFESYMEGKVVVMFRYH